MNDRHERAAALSVFNGYIGHSIRSLKYSANITAQQGQAQRSALDCGIECSSVCMCRVSFRKMGKGGQNNTYKKHGGQRECAR